MNTKRYSPAGIALTVIVLCYLGSVLVLRFGQTERAIGIAAAIACALIGIVFLVLALPLGKLLTRAPRLPFLPVSLPRSASGWSVWLIVAAIVFFTIAGVALYWGTEPAAKPGLIRWLDGLFQ